MARRLRPSDRMEYLVPLLGFLGAWLAVSVVLTIAWARFHSALGARPRPTAEDHAEDSAHDRAA